MFGKYQWQIFAGITIEESLKSHLFEPLHSFCNKSLLHTTEKDGYINQSNVKRSGLNNPEGENVKIKDFQNHTDNEV